LRQLLFSTQNTKSKNAKPFILQVFSAIITARVAEQAARAYTTAGGGMKSIKEGNAVEAFKLGNTSIRICDDYCHNTTSAEVDAILARIACRAQAQLSAQQ
jgi:hypothetical protein